jgi:hypothetical protein
MLDILLFFLGIKSWDVNFFPVRKYTIDTRIESSLKNSKTVNTLKLIADETPSPQMFTYKIKKNRDISDKYKLLYSLYTLYSVMIFLLLSVQPFYSLYRFSQDVTDLKFLSSFLYSSNIPIIYTWEKFYFRSNHLEKELESKKIKTILILGSAIISIIVNFLDVASFYNRYYWLDLFNNNIAFFSIIIVEWVYSRLIIFLYALSFVFVMNSHVLEFKKFVEDLKDGIEWFEDCESPLTTIISRVVITRRQIESTIYYYNDIISLTTLLGGASLVIFIRDLIPGDTDITTEIEFEDHDRYLIHPSIVYISCQFALLLYMTRYAMQRNLVLKYIKSIGFINKFLSKIPDEKIHNKTNGKLDIVALNIADSSSATLDWIILGNILSEQWLDFSVCGISTSDGGLIKKSVAFGSVILFAVSFFEL